MKMDGKTWQNRNWWSGGCAFTYRYNYMFSVCVCITTQMYCVLLADQRKSMFTTYCCEWVEHTWSWRTSTTKSKYWINIKNVYLWKKALYSWHSNSRSPKYLQTHSLARVHRCKFNLMSKLFIVFFQFVFFSCYSPPCSSQ